MKLFNKEANFSHHFGALAATLFAVAISPVQAGEEIFSLESSWDQPEPRLSLRGTEAGEISNSSLVRYGLETKVEAHCYLIKLDARGDAWLWGGTPALPGPVQSVSAPCFRVIQPSRCNQLSGVSHCGHFSCQSRFR